MREEAGDVRPDARGVPACGAASKTRRLSASGRDERRDRRAVEGKETGWTEFVRLHEEGRGLIRVQSGGVACSTFIPQPCDYDRELPRS